MALTFRDKCIDAANRAGIDEPMFIDLDADRKNVEYEDDGVLHIRRGGRRAVFDVSMGQTATAKSQNDKTREIMSILGLPVTDLVLSDESEDLDECCPHCGRSY